jgi:hypothetical protein
MGAEKVSPSWLVTENEIQKKNLLGKPKRESEMRRTGLRGMRRGSMGTPFGKDQCFDKHLLNLPVSKETDGWLIE